MSWKVYIDYRAFEALKLNLPELSTPEALFTRSTVVESFGGIILLFSGTNFDYYELENYNVFYGSWSGEILSEYG